jgi:hypothetical protein
MCDLYSWGKLKVDIKDTEGKILFRRGKILYLTDSLVDALIESRPMPNASRESYVGHAAIDHAFGIDSDDFEHFESFDKVPRSMVADINNGLLDGQYRASNKYDPNKPAPRFTLKGKRKIVFDLELFAAVVNTLTNYGIKLDRKQTAALFKEYKKQKYSLKQCGCAYCCSISLPWLAKLLKDNNLRTANFSSV